MEQNNEKELEQAKENLKLMLEAQANTKYEDWDNIIIQIMDGDKPVLNSRTMRQDLEAIGKLHNQSRGEIFELLVQAMENELAAKKENN
jgi:hypothetical protein